MTSDHVSRIERPDTWLHRPMLQNVKKALANPEPSTHGPTTVIARPKYSAFDEPERLSVAEFRQIHCRLRYPFGGGYAAT